MSRQNLPGLNAPYFDFSDNDQPRMGLDDDWSLQGRWDFFTERGWIWLFDALLQYRVFTEWAGEISEHDQGRIGRLQNLFGCANVAYGPPVRLKDNGYGRLGVWVCKIEHQTRRHRGDDPYPGICKCRSKSYETGEIYR